MSGTARWRRSTGGTLAALGALTLALTSGLSPGALAAGPRDADRLGGVVRGQVDADVLAPGGKVLGHLRASVAASGKGHGVFDRRADGTVGRELADRVVGVTARRTARGATLVVRGHRGLRLRLALSADGELRGTGRIGRQRVHVAGEGGEQLPHLRRDMKMLVVGRPAGEGYEALKKLYRPVRYRPGRHTRTRLRENRDHLHGYAALVLGKDVHPRQARFHELLHRFFGTGKWVIAAPGSSEALASLADLHGHTAENAEVFPAVAMRASGPQGGLDTTRSLVRYPQPAGGAVHLRSKADHAKAATRRARWFRRSLLDWGRAHHEAPDGAEEKAGTGKAGKPEKTEKTGARTARAGRPVARAAQQLGDSYTTAQIKLAVGWSHEVVVGSPQNLARNTLCEQDTKYVGANVWCPGNPLFSAEHYKPEAVSTAGIAKSCTVGMSYGHRMLPIQQMKYFDGLIDQGIVSPSGPLRGERWTTEPFRWNPYVGIGDGSESFMRGLHMGFEGWQASLCPQDIQQTMLLQGNDYYNAMYDPSIGYHTIAVRTDPAVSASMSGVLASTGANGRIRACHTSCGNQLLRETAWFLGAYKHKLSLSGPQLDPLSFEYSASNSFPQKAIDYDSEGTSQSRTIDFNVGVFGESGTLSAGVSFTQSVSAEHTIPNWVATPVPGRREVTQGWTTNRPTPWAVMQAHQWPFTTGEQWGEVGTTYVPPANAPWDLNPLNIGDFNPQSIATWTGKETWGPVNVASSRTVSMVDHFSHVDLRVDPGFARLSDGFAVQDFTFADEVNAITPNTKSPKGPGINLCDPIVASTKYSFDPTKCNNPAPPAPR